MDDLVSIRTFDQRYQAELVQGLLSGEGIESVIIADDCGGQRPDLALRMKGVQLVIRKEDFARADEILAMLEEDLPNEA